MISKYIADFSIKKTVKSVLFKNYFSLSVYQIVNFAVPLIIIPFIISKVGVSNFGQIAFSYAFVNYFNVIVDYGFNLSATQKIAVNQNNKDIINAIFTTVYVSKLLFLVLSIILYSALIFIFPVLYHQKILHLCSFTIVVGQAIIPLWLFQGMQDMKYLAFFNVLSKGIYFIAILLCIKFPKDYYLVNCLQGISSIVAGLFSLFFCYKKFGVRFIYTSRNEIVTEIRNGKMLFFSSVAVNIYVNSNAFILGVFATPAEVGLYSVAEKVYFALKQLNNVFSQVIFPQICTLALKSVSTLKFFLKKIFTPFIALMITASTVVFFSTNIISRYFLKGVIDTHLILLIHIFCAVIIVNALDIPAFQTLLAYNEKNKYGLILISGCVLNIISNIIMVNLLQSLGTVYSILITELFITIGLNYFFFRVLKQKSHEVSQPF